MANKDNKFKPKKEHIEHLVLQGRRSYCTAIEYLIKINDAEIQIAKERQIKIAKDRLDNTRKNQGKDLSAINH